MKKNRLSSAYMILISLAVLTFLPALPAPARVFWRWGTVSQSSKALSSLGGKSVYQADFNINGAKADLSVFSIEQSCDRAIKDIAGVFPSASILYRQGSMAFCFVRDKDTVIRLVIIQLTSESHTLAFKIEQNAQDFEISSRPPQKNLLKELPAVPDGIPQFYAANHDTRLQMATFSSKAAAGEIRSFYSAQLNAEGWYNPLQVESSLLLFIKDNAVCMIFANDDTESETRNITLLHKIHGVK